MSSISGGALAYLRHLAPLLARRFNKSSDHSQIKFLAHKEQQDLLEGVDGSQVTWIPGKRPAGAHRLFWEMRNIQRILEAEGTDLLFTPYQIGPRVVGARQVLMLRNMEPFLCNRYSYSPRSRLRNSILKQASIRSLRKADRVIAVSAFAQDHATKALGLHPDNVITIHHGRDGKIASNAASERDQEHLRMLGIGERYFLTPGSLLPYRRCEDVIAAFDKYCEQTNDEVQLVIAGSGSDLHYAEMIKVRIAASRHRNQILAVGHVPFGAMAALYRQCLICVMATEIEACPNIAIEAMSAGCVVVSSDRPPLPEIFHGASLEYRARDIDHLVENMQISINDGNLRNDLKTRALKRADNFSWEKCADKTYSALVDW